MPLLIFPLAFGSNNSTQRPHADPPVGLQAKRKGDSSEAVLVDSGEATIKSGSES